jgi:hypothetical protein
MCLYLKKDSRAKTAKENIVVYKTMSSFDEGFQSYYQDFLYHPHIIYRKNKGRKFSDAIYTARIYAKKIGFMVALEKEGFHSFVKFSDAIIDSSTKGGIPIVRCIIPKGAKYILGNTSSFSRYGNKCYVSNAIKIEGIVE